MRRDHLVFAGLIKRRVATGLRVAIDPDLDAGVSRAPSRDSRSQQQYSRQVAARVRDEDVRSLLFTATAIRPCRAR